MSEGDRLKRTAPKSAIGLALLTLLLASAVLPGTAQAQVGLLYGERGRADKLNPYGPVRDVFSGRVMSMLYEPLLRYDFNNNAWVNILIEDYQPGEGNATVHLKEGVTWHDGTPFTADDVVFTYDFIQRFSTNADEKRVYLENLNGPPTKLDSRTVLFEFNEGFGGDGRVFLEKPIIPAHVFDVNTGAPRGPDQRLDLNPLGTGAYKFLQYTANRNPILESYQDYHQGRGSLAEVQAETWTDAATVVGTLTARKVSGGMDLIVELPVGVSVALRQQEELVTVRQQESYRMIAIALRQNLGSVLAHEGVRRAITHAINRTELLSTFYEGAGTVLASAWVPTAPNFDPGVVPLEFDPDRAQELLDSAGVSGASLTLVYPVSQHSDDQRRQNTARAIHDALVPLGIDLKLEPLLPEIYNERVDITRDWDMAWVEWEFDPTYAVGQLFHSDKIGEHGGNSMNFTSDPVDSQLGRYQLATDARRKRSISSTLQTMLRDEAPMLFLFSQRNIFAHKVEVSIPTLPDPFHFFADIRTWQYIR